MRLHCSSLILSIAGEGHVVRDHCALAIGSWQSSHQTFYLVLNGTRSHCQVLDVIKTLREALQSLASPQIPQDDTCSVYHRDNNEARQHICLWPGHRSSRWLSGNGCQGLPEEEKCLSLLAGLFPTPSSRSPPAPKWLSIVTCGGRASPASPFYLWGDCRRLVINPGQSHASELRMGFSKNSQRWHGADVAVQQSSCHL